MTQNFIEENRKNNLTMDMKILIGFALAYLVQNHPESLEDYFYQIKEMAEDCDSVFEELEQEEDEEYVEMLIEMYEEYCKK